MNAGKVKCICFQCFVGKKSCMFPVKRNMFRIQVNIKTFLCFYRKITLKFKVKRLIFGKTLFSSIFKTKNWYFEWFFKYYCEKMQVQVHFKKSEKSKVWLHFWEKSKVWGQKWPKSEVQKRGWWPPMWWNINIGLSDIIVSSLNYC